MIRSPESPAQERPRAPAAVAGPVAPVSLAEIFRVEHDNLVRLASVLTQDREDAQDVVQDAFASLQRRWATFDNPAGAGGYLRVSVINGARSVHRRRTLFRRHARADSPVAPAADTPLLLREEYHRVVAAVQRLPRRQQQVIALRYWSELPDVEIAAALAVSESTVRSNASRALGSIAKHLEVKA